VPGAAALITAALLACAVNVAPVTMEAVIRVEHGSPYALNVNHLVGQQPHPATVQEAIATARRYIAAGYSVDMGWSQLNSTNLVRFGYAVEDAYDECKNVAAGGAVLSAFYGRAVQRFGEGQPALMHALSGYNTGDLQRGFFNGYVGRYYINALPAEPRTTPHPPSPQVWTTVAYHRPS
jgi:type IV secretion system protein VirB1